MKILENLSPAEKASLRKYPLTSDKNEVDKHLELCRRACKALKKASPQARSGQADLQAKALSALLKIYVRALKLPKYRRRLIANLPGSDGLKGCEQIPMLLAKLYWVPKNKPKMAHRNGQAVRILLAKGVIADKGRISELLAEGDGLRGLVTRDGPLVSGRARSSTKTIKFPGGVEVTLDQRLVASWKNLACDKTKKKIRLTLVREGSSAQLSYKVTSVVSPKIKPVTNGD